MDVDAGGCCWEDEGFLYVVADSTKPGGVLKVGRTRRAPRKRLSEYPVGSVMLREFRCVRHSAAESRLLAQMRARFRLHCGREYFSGPRERVLAMFDAFCAATPAPMDIG